MIHGNQTLPTCLPHSRPSRQPTSMSTGLSRRIKHEHGLVHGTVVTPHPTPFLPSNFPNPNPNSRQDVSVCVRRATCDVSFRVRGNEVRERWNESTYSGESRRAADRDDVAVVAGNHVGKEGLHCPEMRDTVDVKCAFDGLVAASLVRRAAGKQGEREERDQRKHEGSGVCGLQKQKISTEHGRCVSPQDMSQREGKYHFM